MNVIIIENSEFYKNKLRLLLETKAFYRVINVFLCSSELLKSKDIYNADIIIIDLDISYVEGIECIKRCLFLNKKLLFIAICNNSDGICLVDIISAGIRACIFKSQIDNLLEETLERVINKELYFSCEIKVK